MLAAALAAIYLVWHPPSQDLAAQVFRSHLFATHGFLLWNNAWYDGHYLPGYSLLFPPLGAALGPALVGALSALAAAALFAAVVRDRYGDRARLGAIWFGVGTATMLFTGRITFALGVAIGLGALYALVRRRTSVAFVLTILSTLASPVAGVFLALAGAAAIVGGVRRGGAAVAGAAGATVAAVGFAFPTSGAEPYALSAFIAVPLFVAAALWVLPKEERILRSGAVLYALAAAAAFAVPNPVGGNMTRLGALFGGPLLAVALAKHRSRALALVALPLLYWQWVAPVQDVAASSGTSVNRSYYEPLVSELARRVGATPVRIEIPPTLDRWEATYVAPRFPLARGWLRQLESQDLRLFARGRLTPAAYRGWLNRNGVSYVALPDAELDYMSVNEARLIRAGVPYLREVWRNAHWRLYAVRHPLGLTSAGARLTRMGPDSLSLKASAPGRYLVRVNYTPYWSVISGQGCVAPDGRWTQIDARAPGNIRIAARLSVGGLAGQVGECPA